MPSTRPRIIVSLHGTLVDELFFNLYVSHEDELSRIFTKINSGTCILAKREPPEISAFGQMPRYFKALVACTKMSHPERSLYRCPISLYHACGLWGSGGSRFDSVSAEIISGSKLSPTFIDSETPFVVNPVFGEDLRRSDLRGFELLPLPIHINQSQHRGDPKLEFVQVLGRNCLRRWRVEIDENLCPHCQKGPFYCVDCGWIPVLCQKCFQPLVTSFDFVFDGPPIPSRTGRTTEIVEVKDSGDADFFQYGLGHSMVSRRALIFLLNSGAAPFIAISQWACIDGLSPQQRQEVERSLKTPIPTDRCQIKSWPRP